VHTQCAVLFPRQAERRLPTTDELYRSVHLAIKNLLQRNGRAVEMALFPDQARSDACFEKAFEFDLKLQGKKIAGAAIRRNRKGSLLQGSIQRLKSTGIFEVHPQIDPVLMKDSSDLRGNDSTESLIAPGDISSRPFGSLHRADLARLIFDRLV
jgi:hypothetical protein